MRPGALADLDAIVTRLYPRSRVAVIADAAVIDALGAPLATATTFVFPAGESSKTRESWARITDQLVAAGFDRNSVIIAFGGGVTTDLAGFVAATFLRGIPWIAVPTTTLAMLDAAVGGKTGVNTGAGKNLVGAFHPPAAVISDPRTLRTLPDRAFREGLAEAVKHAATLDASYGDWIAASASAILAHAPQQLEQLIHRSVELKAEIVSVDEREGDRRAVLNAGHTIAHGLERATDYMIPHGEAVAIGLTLETRAGERMSITAPGTADRIANLLSSLGLPYAMPAGVDRARLLTAMQSDKKNRDGSVHAAFVAAFGRMSSDGGNYTQPLDLSAVD